MVSKSRRTGAVKHDRKKALKDYRGFSMNLITNDCDVMIKMMRRYRVFHMD